MGIDYRGEQINTKKKGNLDIIPNDLISVLDDKYINELTEKFLKKYPEYKNSLSNNNFLIEKDIENNINNIILKIYHILIKFKKIEKIYKLFLELKNTKIDIYSYKKYESLIKDGIKIIKDIEKLIYKDFLGEDFSNNSNLIEISNKKEFYNTFFRVKNINIILDKIKFLEEKKYIILDDKDITKSKNFIDIKKIFPKLFETNKLENILFNMDINLYEYISNNGKDKEFIEKLVNNGLNEDIIHTIFKYVLSIRQFVFIDKDFLNKGILGEEDNILQVLDTYKNMVDTCNIEKLEYSITLFQLVKEIGLEEKLFEVYLKKKVEIHKLKNILSMYKNNFDKFKGKTSKIKLLNFLYINYNFSIKHYELIKDIPIKYLDKVQNITNKNCNIVNFYISNKLYKLDLEEKKLAYLYKLSDIYDLEDLLKLNTDKLKTLDKEKISKKYISLILEGESIENIKNKEKINSFKNKIEQKIKYLDGITGIEKDIKEIKELIYKIESKNYELISKKITKKISNFENIINKIKKIEDNGISSKDIIQLINIFLSKKNNKNKLKISNILDIIIYVSEISYKDDLKLIFSLLENKNVHIKKELLSNYENIFKNIINNSELILNYMQINKKNIYISELNDIINSEQNKKQIEEIVENLFNIDLKDFILEKNNKTILNKLIKIAKIIQNKNDIDFYLELVSKENNFINKYYFLVKNLNILGINLSCKYLELFTLIDLEIFTEEKLQNIKKIFKINKTIKDKDIFYQLLLEYLSNNDININIFNILFEEEEEEEEEENNISDDEFIKNTGISGLAGWSGKDIIKNLEKLGFEKKKINGKIQGKGDHILMKNNENTYAMIPLHKTVKAKTLFDTLNRAQISKEDFLNA